MLDGLEHLHSLKTNTRAWRSRSHLSTASRATGMATLSRAYGEHARKLLEHLDELDPGLGMRITEDAYGTVMVRPGLRLAERELVNAVVLFIEGYRRQLHSHLRGALRVGVGLLMLKAVLRCAGSVARKGVRRAIATVDDIVRSQQYVRFDFERENSYFQPKPCKSGYTSSSRASYKG